MEKFEEFLDLGEIVIPLDYVSGQELDTLNPEEFYEFNDDITDAHFSKESVILKPGDIISVKAYIHNFDGVTISEERLNFLSKIKNNIYVGARGVSLVYKYKRDLLPRGYDYCPMDNESGTWIYPYGASVLPCLSVNEEGLFSMSFCFYKYIWPKRCILLSFCRVPRKRSGALK